MTAGPKRPKTGSHFIDSLVVDNEGFVARYACTKIHRFRGKYLRIFAIAPDEVATFNPGTWDLTNSYKYADEFETAYPVASSTDEFEVRVKEKRNSKTFKFSCPQRADVLTDIHQNRLFFKRDSKPVIHEATKYGWQERHIPTRLEVSSYALHQMDDEGRVKAIYPYKDIGEIFKVADSDNGFIIKHALSGRLHYFSSSSRSAIIKQMKDEAISKIGVTFPVDRKCLTQDEYGERRLGVFADDVHITSLQEFNVRKTTPRSPSLVPRILAISETCIVEHDIATYNIVTVRGLATIYAVVRCMDDLQKFVIEYTSGEKRTYLSADRDSIIASLVDGVRASGNLDVHVRIEHSMRGHRIGPLYEPMQPEIESLWLKTLCAHDINEGPEDPNVLNFDDIVARFNTNIDYSGLQYSVTKDAMFAENKERLINTSVTVVLNHLTKRGNVRDEDMTERFHCLRRLVASRTGYEAFTRQIGFKEIIGKVAVVALKSGNDGVTFAVIDVLAALMRPMSATEDRIQETDNKKSLLSSKKFIQLMVDLLVKNAASRTSATVVASLLDFFVYAVCEPYSLTTQQAHFNTVMELLAREASALFNLFEHESMAIVKSVSMVIRAMIREGQPKIVAMLQTTALTSASIVRHIYNAIFLTGDDYRQFYLRTLSQELVGYFLHNNAEGFELIERIFPAGLISALESSEKPPEENAPTKKTDTIKALRKRPKASVWSHWRTKVENKYNVARGMKEEVRTLQLRSVGEALVVTDNWPLFYFYVTRDYVQSDLLWNHQTRQELRDRLELEMRLFQQEMTTGTSHKDRAWNYREFEVPYKCLRNEIKVGDHYLRLLLEEGISKTVSPTICEDDGDGSNDNVVNEGRDTFVIRNPSVFFNDLYHKFLLSEGAEMKSICLQALALVYDRCAFEIGPFHDTPYIMRLLDQTFDRQERDRLLQFLEKLLKSRSNAKQFLDCNGVVKLVDIMTLAHLHRDRAGAVLQSNVLMAGDTEADGEREWFYSTDSEQRKGPFTFKEMSECLGSGTITRKTRCWAQGLDGWLPLEQIAHLKWTLLAEGTAVMTESKVALVCLDCLDHCIRFYPTKEETGEVIRPMPRIQRELSSAQCLPHICQLLLTFDPILVEKAATLVHMIVLDNPLQSNLYTRGIFYFILMYMGSNIRPIARLLHETHTKQAFKRDEARKGVQKFPSILGAMLPHSMVCYLENYGPEKFSQVFLGEFDTPECIWGLEMRQHCIERIAAHLADYSVRLASNIRATYEYAPIPVVEYPQLAKEIFCDQFYLRQLCNVEKFPGWPVKEPVDLLQSLLMMWKEEVDKKPSIMTLQVALKVLGFTLDAQGQMPKEATIRRAYFKLAQQFHPDKNKEEGAREMFEKVASAYEFICDEKRLGVTGPNAEWIVLLMEAQSLLFERYDTTLAPYKYAGYPLLVHSITKETEDEALFSKGDFVLAAATKLAHSTMACSPRNAEELRREHGIQALAAAFNRCLSVVTMNSQQSEMPVQTCTHTVNAFAGFGKFDECRKVVQEIPNVVMDLTRCLFVKGATDLVLACLQCGTGFGYSESLQNQLLDAGALWHVLWFCFSYDYTLEEGGVDTESASNQQVKINTVAKWSVRMAASMAGYHHESSSSDPFADADADGEENPFGDAPSPPENERVFNCISGMLTSFLADKFKDNDPNAVLKLLNTNSATPYLIWNNSTRNELKKILERNQMSKIKSDQQDEDLGANVVLASHAEQLKVGSIYIHNYLLDPTYELVDAGEFVADMLEWLEDYHEFHVVAKATGEAREAAAASGTGTNEGEGGDHDEGEEDDYMVDMTEEDLRHVVHALSVCLFNNNTACTSVIGNFDIIFKYVVYDNVTVAGHVLVAMGICLRNKECIVDIVDVQELGKLLISLAKLKESRSQNLSVTLTLMSHPKLVAEGLRKAALLHLLYIFCHSVEQSIREQAAQVMCLMTADKLHGKKVAIFIGKFLPGIFLEAMRDNATSTVQIFESQQENPELIWNDEVRASTVKAIKTMRDEWLALQIKDDKQTYKFPKGFTNVLSSSKDGGLFVGGVHIALYNKQPNWTLRNAREFGVALFDALDTYAKARPVQLEDFASLATATVNILSAMKAAPDQFASVGHIPHMFEALKAMITEQLPEAVIKPVTDVLACVAGYQACVAHFDRCDSAATMLLVLRKFRANEHVVLNCAHLLNRLAVELLKMETTNWVSQAMEVKMIQTILDILSDGLDGMKEAPGIRALFAKALKALSQVPKGGDLVEKILDGSRVWDTFRGQKHDLFIQNTQVSGMLTSSTQVAGMLTSSSFNNESPSTPPPLSK